MDIAATAKIRTCKAEEGYWLSVALIEAAARAPLPLAML